MKHDKLSLEKIIDGLRNQPGALLPILHGIQNHFGYISTVAQTQIAEALNLSTAEIHGVISFYEDFKTQAGAKHTVQICRAEACQSVGGRQLEQYLKDDLGVEYYQTTKDGQMQLEPVYCLGNCACGPSIKIGQKTHGRVTTAKAESLIGNLTNPGEAEI